MSESITITVNGTPESIAPMRVVDLLAARNLSPDKVAIELNRRLLKSDRYETLLKDGDALEIVTFVGGG